MLRNVAGQFIGAQSNSYTGTPTTTGTMTVYLTGDNGAQSSIGLATHKGNGYWSIALTAAQTNYRHLAFTFVSSAASTLEVTVQVETQVSQVLYCGTIASVMSQTIFMLTDGSATVADASADNNAYNGCLIVVRDATTEAQCCCGVIASYAGATRTITLLNDPAIFTIAAGDLVTILADRGLKATVDNRTLDVSATGEAGLDWANIGSPAASQPDVNVEKWNTTAVPAEHTAGYPIVTVKDGTGTGEIDTTNGGVLVSTLATQAKADVNTQADIAIAEASLATAANLATVAGYLDTEMSATLTAALAIKTKTDQLVFTVANQVDANALSGGGGGGLDAAGVRSAMGLAAANLDTQLAAKATQTSVDDLPTNAELAAAFTQIKGATWTTTDTLEAIRDRGDAAWTTATGFSTHSAADVVMAMGTGAFLTALPWNAAWDAEVQSEATDALAAFGVSTLTAAQVNAEADTAIADASLATAANLATVAGYLDTEMAATLAAANAIKTKTDQLVFTVANQVDANALTGGGGGSGLDAAGVRAAIGLASANLDTQLSTIDDFLDSEVAAIKAKTDNLPSDPADASDIASSFAMVNTKLDAIDDYIDSEVSAIKAKTDQLTFTVANQVNANAMTGGGLDASGVRSAVGLAAPNLDTQLAAKATQTSVDDLPTNAELAAALAAADDAVLDRLGTPAGASIAADIAAIPTVDEIDTELTAEHGAGSWGTAGSGSGARSVTITVDDGADPIENAKVRVTSGAESYLLETDTDGEAVFALDDATWAITVTKSGYTGESAALVVNGTESVTYSLDQVTFTPSDPGQVTGFLYCYGSNGSVAEGVFVSLMQIRVPEGSEGAAFNGARRTDTSDATGLIEFVGMIPGAAYKIWRGTTRVREAEITVPSDAMNTWEIPSIVGG